MHDLHIGGLAAYAIKRGGSLYPIIVPKEALGNETGLMNPSVFVHNGRILVNVRHVNYILYHSEAKKFPHQWGPLVYVHPQNDVTLTTYNVICEYDQDMNFISAGRVNTKDFDTKPTWNFIGLEDARLFAWDDRLFLCGVRRDCYDNKGKGRMEMAEVEFIDNEWKEVSRNPIPAPGDDLSYCEKNWMPVMDMPYHFVKWTNPTQVVKYDIEEKTTTEVVLDESKFIQFNNDLRGGSQVIRMNPDQRMTFCHQTNLLKDPFLRKDGDYSHRVVIWDNEWNIIHASKQFYFFGSHHDHASSNKYTIEFVTGTQVLGDDILISFGLSDNACYILRMPVKVFLEFLKV